MAVITKKQREKLRELSIYDILDNKKGCVSDSGDDLLCYLVDIHAKAKEAHAKASSELKAFNNAEYLRLKAAESATLDAKCQAAEDVENYIG